MPDRRKHRGPHPQDPALFAEDRLPALCAATADLSWLLGRGYAALSAITLVGDHWQLQRRQRLAVKRSACADTALRHRLTGRVGVADGPIVVDGFNVLISVEAALCGGVLLRGRDGLLRDLASVHGNYRKVAETERALGLLSSVLASAPEVLWLLDRPVSNSGRVAQLLRQAGFAVRLEDRVDQVAATLCEDGRALATADGPLLDQVAHGVDLVGAVVAGVEGAWIMDLAAAR
ncbi:MAG: DUF434 domain-containing protein [Oligoflexia bacterium]|nr:DUF434 domain-containing protein [Oligoflexia bacterium]